MANQILTFFAAAAFCTASYAAPAAAPVHAEIDMLLGRLQTSGCQFNRNGSWYSGAEAKSHLLRKLEYFEDKGNVQSTEQFIDLAASKSSSSGKPFDILPSLSLAAATCAERKGIPTMLRDDLRGRFGGFLLHRAA